MVSASVAVPIRSEGTSEIRNCLAIDRRQPLKENSMQCLGIKTRQTRSSNERGARGRHPAKRKSPYLTHFFYIAAMICSMSAVTFATIFGTVRGIVHDPQHRPIQGAHVVLKARNSEWTVTQDSDANGEVEFNSVPIGDYTVTVTAQGFAEQAVALIVKSDTSPVLHLQLGVAGVKQSV